MREVSRVESMRDRKVAKIQSTYVEQVEHKQQKQKKKKKGLARRLLLFAVITTVLSVLTVSTLLSQSSAIQEKEEKKQEVEMQLAKLEKEQRLLEEEIVKLNDDEYIAKIARRDYFLSNEGEVIFNLPNTTEDKD